MKEIKKVWEDPEYKKRLYIAKKNWWVTATDDQKENRLKGLKKYNTYIKSLES